MNGADKRSLGLRVLDGVTSGGCLPAGAISAAFYHAHFCSSSLDLGF
jgi:hypothetical protein